MVNQDLDDRPSNDRVKISRRTLVSSTNVPFRAGPGMESSPGYPRVAPLGVFCFVCLSVEVARYHAETIRQNVSWVGIKEYKDHHQNIPMCNTVESSNTSNSFLYLNLIVWSPEASPDSTSETP